VSTPHARRGAPTRPPVVTARTRHPWRLPCRAFSARPCDARRAQRRKGTPFGIIDSVCLINPDERGCLSCRRGRRARWSSVDQAPSGVAARRPPPGVRAGMPCRPALPTASARRGPLSRAPRGRGAATFRRSFFGYFLVDTRKYLARLQRAKPVEVKRTDSQASVVAVGNQSPDGDVPACSLRSQTGLHPLLRPVHAVTSRGYIPLSSRPSG